MKNNRICILGGTGFVGHHLIYRLAAVGYRCRVLVRRPSRHRELNLIPTLEMRQADLFDRDDLRRQLIGCDIVINLAGILNESGTTTFERVHVELVRTLVEAARDAGVRRVLHMSALNADANAGRSRYLRSKGAGEDLAHGQAGTDLGVTSFQPSVIFGRGDHFFNRFASLLRLAPGVFPLACPEARLAPVHVGDVVEAFQAALHDPTTHGQRYQLCGPRVFALQELVEYTAKAIGRRIRVIGLDDRMSHLQARVFERLPGKPFSQDNYLSLQTASVCASDGLAALGVSAADIEGIVPSYLS